jgi:hypothetical protein
MRGLFFGSSLSGAESVGYPDANCLKQKKLKALSELYKLSIGHTVRVRV